MLLITFIIWNGYDYEITEFLYHLNNFQPPIRLTMEKENNAELPFLVVLIKTSKHKQLILSIRVSTKPYILVQNLYTVTYGHSTLKYPIPRKILSHNSYTDDLMGNTTEEQLYFLTITYIREMAEEVRFIAAYHKMKTALRAQQMILSIATKRAQRTPHHRKIIKYLDNLVSHMLMRPNYP